MTAWLSFTAKKPLTKQDNKRGNSECGLATKPTQMQGGKKNVPGLIHISAFAFDPQ